MNNKLSWVFLLFKPVTAAKQESKKERVILLFEVWRLEIREAERELITTVLPAAAEYNEKRVE